MLSDHDRNPDAAGLRVAIAVSRYHPAVTDVLCSGAIEAFTRAGGTRDDLRIVPAPGAFELPAICRALAGRCDVDGVVALGCIIRGETSHDQHLAQAIAQGLTDVSVATGKPIAFGVLTCHTHQQARARAGGDKGNKGEEAMAAAIEAIQTIRDVGAERVAAMEGHDR